MAKTATRKKTARKKTAKKAARKKTAKKAARKKTAKKAARKKTAKKAARKKTAKKTARKKTAKKAARKKTTRKARARRAIAPTSALAMNAAAFDEFYPDEINLGPGKNARSASERRLTRHAAMILWREEDIGALVRDETGAVWGWALQRY